MSITIGAGITIGNGITLGPKGFTISSSDLVAGQPIYQNTTALGTNGVDGFQNTAAETWLGEGYVSYNLPDATSAKITAEYDRLGLNPLNSTGYVWNVTWGPGSSITTGLVKIGFYNGGGIPNNGYLDIQAIDPSDTRWEEPNNNNGTSLVGTFLFPATFTIYNPLTNKGNWC